MKKLYLLALFLTGAVFAHPEEILVDADAAPVADLIGDYYVSNCLGGADGDCVPGNDSNNGKTPATAWKTLSNAMQNTRSDKIILLARGGSYLASTGRFSRSDFTLADYHSAWGSGNEGRPLVTQNGSSAIFKINPGHHQTQSNITFKNIALRCSSSSAVGLFFWMKSDNVTLDGIEVYGCGIGIQYGNPAGYTSDKFTLKNSIIRDNTGQGFLGSGNNFVFDNNVFSDNGTQSGTNHNLYLENKSSGIKLTNNVFEHVNRACNAPSVVVHGVHADLIISGNKFNEMAASTGEGCWPLTVASAYGGAESFTNVVIENNEINTKSNLAIGINSCKNCLVKNNRITGAGIKIPLRAPGKNDISTTGLILQKNTITANQCLLITLPASSFTETNTICNKN